MVNVYELDLAFPVKVEQDPETHLFRVTYGLQVKEGLTYGQAAEEFGLSVFHALACDGLISSEDETDE